MKTQASRALLGVVAILLGCRLFTPQAPAPSLATLALTPLPDPSASPSSSPSPTPEPPRPNIIFILTDDLDAAAWKFMPLLSQALIEEGALLPNFFANVPLCCPSRASILLGQYAHNTRILTNRPPDGGFELFYQMGLEQHTIGVQLQEAGYRTMFLGKYLNGYPREAPLGYVPPGWSEWRSPAAGRPYTEYNYTLNVNGELVEYGDGTQDYLTDVLSAAAVKLVRQQAASEQPFFMFLATYAPHNPSTPAQRHRQLFRDEVVPRLPSYNEEDTGDKPDHIQDRPRLKRDIQEALDERYVERLQSLQAVDETVAALVTALQETGELENTYIFFTSDNGFHMGLHRLLMGKRTAYEEDIRIPLAVRGPGIPPGTVLPLLGGTVDLAPTFAEIAGLPQSTQYDGRSLLGRLHNPDAPESDWRQVFLVEHWDTGSGDEEFSLSWLFDFARSQQLVEGGVWVQAISGMSGTGSAWEGDGILEPPDLDDLQQGVFPSFRGLRGADYVYVEFDSGDREFYDLQADPYQLENQIDDIDAQFLEDLSAWLARLAACQGDECRSVEFSP